MSQHIPKAASTPAAGPLVTNSIGIRLVYIPPGTFMMGSPENEPRRHENEVLHQVTLTRGFYIGIMPVTQGEFRAVMKRNRCYFKSSVPNQDEDLPVECVEWRETQTFCTRLGKKEARRYRLPTEAEWEYACRAGTTTPFSTGDTIATSQANYDDKCQDDGTPGGGYRRKPTRVGMFAPNAWGLHDMHGNVCEWCEDFYAPLSVTPATDPIGPQTGTDRVIRGGSFRDPAKELRSARRIAREAVGWSYHVGFRLVMEVDEPPVLQA